MELLLTEIGKTIGDVVWGKKSRVHSFDKYVEALSYARHHAKRWEELMIAQSRLCAYETRVTETDNLY